MLLFEDLIASGEKSGIRYAWNEKAFPEVARAHSRRRE